LKRIFRVGPGTVLALIAGAGLLIANRNAIGVRPQPEVEHIPAIHSAPLKLWKPEPKLIIDHKAEIKLSAGQTKRIASLSAAWGRERVNLEGEMSAAATGANAGMAQAQPGHAVPAAQLTSGLRDYSALSREYDARRRRYWDDALSLLNRAQRERIEQIHARGTIERRP